MAAAGAKLLILRGAVAGALGVAAAGCGGNDGESLRAIHAAPGKTIAAKTALMDFEARITADSDDLSFDATIRGEGRIDFENESGEYSLDMSEFATQARLLGASTSKIGAADDWRGKVIDYRGVSYIRMPALHRFYTRARKPWIELSPADVSALSLDGVQTKDFLQLLRAATRAEDRGQDLYGVKIPIERARTILPAATVERLAGYFRNLEKLSRDEIELDVRLDDAGRVTHYGQEFQLKQKGVSGGGSSSTDLSAFGVYAFVEPPPASQIEPASVLSKHPAGETLTRAVAKTQTQRARVSLRLESPKASGAGARPSVRSGIFDFAHDRGRLHFVGEYGNDARFLGGTTYYRSSAYSGGGGRKPWQRFTCPFTHTVSRYPTDVTDAFDDPRFALRLLDRHGRGFARAGRAVVGGARTTRYHGTIAPGTLRREEVDVWIDDRGLIRRARLTAYGGASVLTLDLPAYGVAVHVERPAGDRTEPVACRAPKRVGG